MGKGWLSFLTPTVHSGSIGRVKKECYQEIKGKRGESNWLERSFGSSRSLYAKKSYPWECHYVKKILHRTFLGTRDPGKAVFCLYRIFPVFLEFLNISIAVNSIKRQMMPLRGFFFIF